MVIDVDLGEAALRPLPRRALELGAIMWHGPHQWGIALPVPVREVAMVRLTRNAAEPLVAELPVVKP